MTDGPGGHDLTRARVDYRSLGFSSSRRPHSDTGLQGGIDSTDLERQGLRACCAV